MISTRSIVTFSLQNHTKHPCLRGKCTPISIFSNHSRISLSSQGTSFSTTKSSPSSSSSSLSSHSYSSSIALAGICLTSGYLLGRYHEEQNKYSSNDNKRVLPNGLPRTCCEESSSSKQLSKEQEALPHLLKSIVGSKNVLDGSTKMYTKGARLGQGDALCIVTPQSLQEVVDCIEVVVNSNCTVLPQGRNTGLTGGSVPRSDNASNRPVVIINTQYLDNIIPIDDGKRVLCYAGVGIGTLSNTLSEQYPDRESHSILGSTFLNPTTAAGVSFGSGGTQIRKGPAYTDRALYLKVVEKEGDDNKAGKHSVQIVNTLGIEGIDDIPCLLSLGTNDKKKALSSNTKAQASDTTYSTRLCDLNSDISRFNGDTTGCDCNRSEGKVFLLATVHDTFPKPKEQKTYWISFPDYETACAFRAQVALVNPIELPTSMEYINRDAFDIIDRSGRIMAHMIQLVGPTSVVLTKLWNVKLFIESLPLPGSDEFCDHILHIFNFWTFPALPKQIQKSGKEMDHHVMVTIPDYQGDSKSFHKFTERVNEFKKMNSKNNSVTFHECAKQNEVDAINAFRFVAAIAFRTWCVGEGVQGISVDYALPKNYTAGMPPLLPDSTTTTSAATAIPVKRMRYAHFGCNVIHEDLAYANNINVHDAHMTFKKAIEFTCKGKLPAEHGHGTEYHAPIDTLQRWKKMDPCNVMNPGVGGLSSGYKYQD